MKKNKKFILMPMIAGLLTACGAPNTELPKGYTIVDPTNKTQMEAFERKLTNNLQKTATEAAKGEKTEVELKLGNFSYTANDEYTDAFIKISDFYLKTTSYQSGDPSNLNNYCAIQKLEDFGFKVSARDGDKRYSLKVSDIDIYLYASKGKMYIDLSDKDILNAIDDFYDFMVGIDSSIEKSKKEFENAKQYCTKIQIPFASNAIISSDNLSSSGELDIDDLSDTLKGLLSTITSGLPITGDFSKAIVLADYEDSDSAGIGIYLGPIFEEIKKNMNSSINNTLSNVGMNVRMDFDGDANAMILFDELGLLSYGALNVDLKYSMSASGSSQSFDLSGLTFESNISYGEQNIEFPDFSDYKESDLDLTDIEDLLDELL